MSRWRRLAPILAAIYALPAAAWIIVARGLVPLLIREAYHGRSWPLLNRVFQRRIPHPVEHYLDLWDVAWKALLLTWLVHLLVVIAVLWSDRWLVGSKREARTINRGLIAFALAFLGLSVLSGPRHDYVAYLEMWSEVMAGRDPWWIHPTWGYPLNAYGPLFNVLVLPAWLNPMAPKLLFALSYCLFVVVFLKHGMAARPESFPTWGLFAWLASPFAWAEVAYFGHFDVLVALTCVAAVVCLQRGREALSGVSLAVGFLLKLIPVVIVPFFALDGRRVRLRLLAGALVPMVLGYAVSFGIWGPTTFRPLAFASRRGSTLLSIFRYLRGGASPLHRFLDHPDLDAWSIPCLAVAGLLVWLACHWRRAEPETSALLAVLTTLLFYKVGFIQYQMILFLLMAGWLGRYATVLPRQRGLALAIGAYFGWLTLFDLFYVTTGGVLHDDGPWAWVVDRAGLPTFLLGLVLLVNLLRVAGRLRVV